MVKARFKIIPLLLSTISLNLDFVIFIVFSNVINKKVKYKNVNTFKKSLNHLITN